MMKVILALVASLFFLVFALAIGGFLVLCLWQTILHPQYGVPVWVAAWIGLAWALHHADLIRWAYHGIFVMKLSLIISALCFTSIALASPTRGTLVACRELESHQGVIYHVELKGGEKTLVDAHGMSAGGNIDCILYKNADAVAQDINVSDACHMEYTPSVTGTYDLVVVNKGNISNKLTLTVQ